MLGLAFFTFECDKINLFALELCQVKIKITPTNHQSAPIADIHIPVAQNHSVLR